MFTAFIYTCIQATVDQTTFLNHILNRQPATESATRSWIGKWQKTALQTHWTLVLAIFPFLRSQWYVHSPHLYLCWSSFRSDQYFYISVRIGNWICKWKETALQTHWTLVLAICPFLRHQCYVHSLQLYLRWSFFRSEQCSISQSESATESATGNLIGIWIVNRQLNRQPAIGNPLLTLLTYENRHFKTRVR